MSEKTDVPDGVDAKSLAREGLSGAQLQALDSFLSISGGSGAEADAEARRVLEAFRWNVEAAVHAALLGETVQFPPPGLASGLKEDDDDEDVPPPLPDGTYSAGDHQPVYSQYTPPSTSTSTMDERGAGRQGGGAFSAFWDSLSSAVQRVGEAFTSSVEISPTAAGGSLSGGARAENRQAAGRSPFEELWAEKYADYEHPILLPVATFEQAVLEAKRTTRLLLVYLHSDLHPDSDAFCTQSLAHAALRSAPLADLLFFAADISTAGGLLAQRALGAAAFPFVAMVMVGEPRHAGSGSGSGTGRPENAANVVWRSEGLMDAEVFIRLITGLFNQYNPILRDRERVRTQREAERTIRREQDAEYLRSLRADEEKDRLAEMEREMQERAAREKAAEELRQAELVEQARRSADQAAHERVVSARRSLDLHAEPQGSAEAVHIAIRLPDGTQCRRRFSPEAPVSVLFAFVDWFSGHEWDAKASGGDSKGDSKGEGEGDGEGEGKRPPLLLSCLYKLVANYPRREFQRGSSDSLRDCGLYPQGVLFVQECRDADDSGH